MRCDELEDALSAFIDGELDTDRAAIISAHLAGCPACRARIAVDRLLGRRLAVAAREPAPQHFAERLRSALAELREHERPPHPRARAAGMRKLPELAAASDGTPLIERRFDGGRIVVLPSRVARQVYLIVDYGAATDTHRRLDLWAPDGRTASVRLPDAGSDGRGVAIKDLDDAATALFVELLSDPATTGSLVA